MNHKHSFLTRCLAMLLALVLVLSNANIGLTMRLQAAETGNLFELIADSNVGNKELNAVLNYADALYNVNDEKVNCPAAPEAADATLISGVLTVNPVNGWVPYTVNGEKVALVDNKVVMNVEGESARVVYKLDLNMDEIIAKYLNLVAALAVEAQEQDAALTAVLALNDDGSSDTMTGLNVLTPSFLDDMAWAVECLTLDALGEDADLNKDGSIDDLDEVELAIIKVEYLQIIADMNELIVTADQNTEYDVEVNGRYPNRNKMVVRVMLSDYMNQGLVSYYKNAAAYAAEFEKLSAKLDEILNVTDSDAVLNTLIADMGYGSRVQASHLGAMQQRLAVCVEAMNALTKHETEMNLNSAELEGLVAALLAVSNTEYATTDLCLYSGELSVRDDSWRWVKVILGDTGKYVDVRLTRNSVITEADVAAIIAAAEAEIPFYTVDTADIEALLGMTMSENIEVVCDVVLKGYVVPVVDAEGNKIGEYTVSVGNNTITIVVPEGHEHTYMIGETVVVARGEVTVELDLDAIAADPNFAIVLVDDFDIYSDILTNAENGLFAALTDALGANAVEVAYGEDGVASALAINVTAGELETFVEVLSQFATEGKLGTIRLNGNEFIAYVDGSPVFSMAAMTDALLGNPAFLNSENMIAMGNGEDANMTMLDTQIKLGYTMDFKLNLTAVPEQMATVAKALEVLDFLMTFTAEPGTAERAAEHVLANKNKLLVNVDLPEKVYEAYVTSLMLSGYMDDDEVADLDTAVTMAFVSDYFNMVKNAQIDIDVLANTLKSVGIDRDISAAEEYVNLVTSVLHSQGTQAYAIDRRAYADFYMTKDNVVDILEFMGITLGAAEAFIKGDEDIIFPLAVELVNEDPSFDALIIEPANVLDDSNMAKLNTFNYTTDLLTEIESMGGPIFAFLLDDINGDLEFPSHAIVDLNGQTIKGDLKANGKIVVIDSCMNTYGGGVVEGTVKATGGAIIGGTFGGDVTNFLRDGYIQENGSVRNAMFAMEIVNGAITYVVNPDFYEICDGYLPSVEALAVEIATDLALNFYPAAGVSYHGDAGKNKLFGLDFDNILSSYVGGAVNGGIDGVLDAMIQDAIQFIGVDGLNDLTNQIIDDLTTFDAMADALNNGTALGSYKFTVHPLIVTPVLNDATNSLDVTIEANDNHGKTFEIALAIDKDADNKVVEYTRDLVTAMSEILFVDAGVNLEPIVYNTAKNDLDVKGSLYNHVTLDFTNPASPSDMNYTKGLAIILAYGNPEYKDALMGARNCVVELNAIIREMTVADVFGALKAMSYDVSMAEMADAVGYQYGADEIAKLEQVYHVILTGVGKVLEVLDVTGNNNQLAEYDANGDSAYTYGRTADADAHLGFFSYDGAFTITSASASVTIKLAPKCTGLIGDADWDGSVTSFDSALILEYKAYLCDEYDLHLCVSDVDADGVVTSFDAAMILEYKAHLIDRFPAEEN